MESWNAARSKYKDFDLDSIVQYSTIAFDVLKGTADEWDVFFRAFEMKMKSGNAEIVMSSYEQLLALQKEMNKQAYDAGVDVSTIPGYMGIVQYLESMKDIYAEAQSLMEAVTSTESAAAVARMSTFQQMQEADRAIAEGTQTNTELLEEYAAALDAVALSYKDGTFFGEQMYVAVLQQMAKSFPNLIKYSKEYANWSH